MNVRKPNAIRGSFLWSNTKIWLVLVVYVILKGSEESTASPNLRDLFTWMSKSEGEYEALNSSIEEVSQNSENTITTHSTRPCQYFRYGKRLICNGFIDFAYLKTLQNEEITDFIVEKYEAEALYKEKYWSGNKLKTGEWYIQLPKSYQKLKGEINIKDPGIHIIVISSIYPQRNLNTGYIIEGEAFSNSIKLSWKLMGELSLDFVNNRTVVSITVIPVASDSDWSIQGNLTFSSRNLESEIDQWKASGAIKSYSFSDKQYVTYKGIVGTRVVKEECKFSGSISLSSVNLITTFSGNISPPQKKKITIPKSAFSNMTMKNIVFKDSHFYNDFHKNSFEGLHGVETVSFTGSKLEVMPKLDELFRNVMNIREINIEDCLTPGLKFGTLTNLKNLQRLSFKGSGPLYFDELSFLWLRDSNLTHLNLENSHVKFKIKEKFLLWSVNNTLKYLDISYSTITEEKDLVTILTSLNIAHLVADGLHLKKIPTAALSSVRKSLQTLSLRRSDFGKAVNKNIFDNVFKFPHMPALTELNLMECHINYIERGAFDDLPSLKILHLAYNNLENLQDGWEILKPDIRYLDLSFNGLTQHSPTVGVRDGSATMNLKTFEKLEVLNLSNGIFTDVKTLIASLPSSVKNLSLSNTNLEDIPKDTFQNLIQLETLDMSHNRNIRTGQSFSFDIFKNLKSLKVLDLKYCGISSSAIFPEIMLENQDVEHFKLDKLEYLDLSSNNIKILDQGTVRIFPKLKILNLSGNSITVWKASLFNTNEHLKTVFLDENKIETLTTEMISDIKKLKRVKLGNNPFICGSYVYDVLKMVNELRKTEEKAQIFRKNFFNGNTMSEENIEDLMKISEKGRFGFMKQLYLKFKQHKEEEEEEEENGDFNGDEVNFLDWSDFNYMCFSWSQSKFIPFTLVNESFEVEIERNSEAQETTLLRLIIVVVVGIVFTIGIIFWKFLDVHLITRAVRNAVALSFLLRGEKEPAKYEYNVFISYSDKDRSWVVENLLPRLESWSDVKVCLHERDFQVGLSIMENIIASIDSSKNIILVLSQSFLKSQWCQYEMHLAQHRLLEKGRDQLILILLENIPLIKRPKTLRYLMMTRTYIEWPVNSKDGKEVESFWNRLLKSLRKSTKDLNVKQKFLTQAN